MMLDIINNLDVLLKNIISFKASVCLLETPIAEEVQIEGLKILKRLNKEILMMHTRYFKVLESIITSLKEEHLTIIIDIISNSILEMLNLKQGYFLLRKILKNVKQSYLQNKILSLIIDQHFIEFMSHNNGCLLGQCIVRNFIVNKGKSTVWKNSQSFNKQIIKKAYNNIVINDKLIDKSLGEETSIEDKDYAPLSRFFDNFVRRILPNYVSFNFSKSVSKSHKKILEAFFEIDSNYFKFRFSQTLILNKGNLADSIVRQTLNLNNGNLESFKAFLLKKDDCPDIFRKLTACLGSVCLKGFANEIINDWNSFLLKLNNNNTMRYELDSPMELLNINSFDPSQKPLTEEANPNFKCKLFVRIDDLGSSDSDDEMSVNQFDDFVCTNQTFFLDHEISGYARTNKFPSKQKPKMNQYLKSIAGIANKAKMLEQPSISKVPTGFLTAQVHTNLIAQETIKHNNIYYPSQVIANQIQNLELGHRNSIYSPFFNNGRLIYQRYVPIPQFHNSRQHIGISQSKASPNEFKYISK